MKPAPFEYAAARSLAEALELLAEHGEEAKALAGGQSLVPLLHRRRLRPRLLVDLNRIEGLDYIREEAEGIALGALARQRDAELSDLVRAGAPLLHDVLPGLGGLGIRNRGTVVGNLTTADPEGQLTPVAVALDATLHVVGPRGERELAAAELFRGPFRTSLEPDELVTELRIPRPSRRTGSAWVELAARYGDRPIVGAAAVVTLGSDGFCSSAGLVLSGAGPTPFDAAGAAALLAGKRPSPALLAAAAERAATAADPPSDAIASTAYRRRLVRALSARALALAASRAEEQL